MTGKNPTLTSQLTKITRHRIGLAELEAVKDGLDAARKMLSGLVADFKAVQNWQITSFAEGGGAT